MPVVVREAPRPSRLRRRWMSVSFVLRWIVAVRGILFSLTFVEALDQFEKAPHLLLRADGDADVTWGDVFAVAENDSLFGEIGDQTGAGGAEIDEDEISGAWVGVEAEFVEFGFKPRAEAENIFNVAL